MIETWDRRDALRWRSNSDDALYRDHPRLDRGACARAMHVVTPDGEIYSGARAFLEIARIVPRLSPLRILAGAPGGCLVMESFYRWIARHRAGISGACRIR
jgi:predicted DCC family thiol-disulfide oxidoreductase YuxK